jgi:hypothetical protein
MGRDSQIADEAVGALREAGRVLEELAVEEAHDLILGLRHQDEELCLPQVPQKMVPEACL